MIQQSANEFARKEIMPVAAKMDRENIAYALFKLLEREKVLVEKYRGDNSGR